MAHQRYYNSKRVRLPSVTTVLEIVEKPALKRWAWTQGQEGLNYEDTSRDSMWRGTLTHLACELDERTTAMSLCESDELRLAVAANYDAFYRWCKDNNVTIDPSHKEIKLVSELKGYGGTCDFVCTMGVGAVNCPQRMMLNSVRLLVDIKTSKAIYTETVLPQLAAYAGAWLETHPDEPLDGVAALHLRDGVATLHRWSMDQCVVGLSMFLAALELYRAKKAVGALKARVG
jgi:hypothetical protein